MGEIKREIKRHREVVPIKQNVPNFQCLVEDFFFECVCVLFFPWVTMYK